MKSGHISVMRHCLSCPAPPDALAVGGRLDKLRFMMSVDAMHPQGHAPCGPEGLPVA
ncbi:hypothetical protein [Komagataeibacter kakiaceti]|uniref:hypothetical protein n=1 Tax=Komagataeibacter kakiaceti TaxID=943261 RepID=UPI00131F03F9|nr:hypothetical protein [Komagataeibacter kakiaceti]